MDEPQRKAKIGVAPYPDGSGYAATVTAFTDECDDPVFEVNTVWRLPASAWPELRAAIDAALSLVAPEPKP